MTRDSRVAAARSLGEAALAVVAKSAYPRPLRGLSIDVSAYELGRILARRERRRRKARIRRAVVIGAAFGAAAFAAAHARRTTEE
jgi:hypothetical protein